MIISHISSSDPVSDIVEMLIEDQGGQTFVNDQIFSDDHGDDVHHYLTHFEEIKEEEFQVESVDQEKQEGSEGHEKIIEEQNI